MKINSPDTELGRGEDRRRLLVALLKDRFGDDERIVDVATGLAQRPDQEQVTRLVLDARSLEELVTG